MPSGDGLPEGLYEVGRTVNLPSFGNRAQPRRQPFKASEAIAPPVIEPKLRRFIPSLYNSKLSDSHNFPKRGDNKYRHRVSEPRAVATGSISPAGFLRAHLDPVATARGSDTDWRPFPARVGELSA